MPTVDELLNNTIESQVCTIDPDTRVINVPACYKEFGVEADEKVNRIKFQCPKIVGDNIDLTTFNLYINYMNARGNYNAYLVDDVTVFGDNIMFSWLLSRHVTEKSGTVNYIVCAKKSDDTSVLNEWNTKVATATVGVGLEATTVVEEQNADVIEQILIKLNSSKNDEPLVVNFSNDRGKIYTDKNVETICNAAASGRRVLTNNGTVLTHYNIGGAANDKLYWALFAGSSNAQNAEIGFLATEAYCGNVSGSFIGPWNQYYVEDLTNPLGLRNSKVGQIAEISMVDSNGKPTSWRTVDVLTTTNTTTFTPTEDYHPATKKYIDVNLRNLASATMDYVDEAINSIPSESNVSLNVTGATVGQTVKISAVDANGVPTAWVPVDMATGGGECGWDEDFELIIDDTVPANAAGYTNDKDINGESFALREWVSILWTPAHTDDDHGNVGRGVGFIPASRWGVALFNITSTIKKSDGIGKYDVLHIKVVNGYQMQLLHTRSQNTTNVFGTMLQDVTAGNSPINFKSDATALFEPSNATGYATCVKIVGYVNECVPAGTRIKLYGKRVKS